MNLKGILPIIFIGCLMLFVPVTSADASTSYTRNFNKQYTFSLYGENVKFVKWNSKSYGIQNLEYMEFMEGSTYVIVSDQLGILRIPKNVSTKKKVTFNANDELYSKTKKVTFHHKVKTKYKTFQNCMKFSYNGTTLYFAPKHGLIKYKINGNTVLQLKKVK